MGNIRITDLRVQRTGRVWLVPARQGDRAWSDYSTVLGFVEKGDKGWRFKCADCRPFWGPIVRTRREALMGLIEHWNEENTDD